MTVILKGVALSILMEGEASLDQFTLENTTQTFGKENMFSIALPNRID